MHHNQSIRFPRCASQRRKGGFTLIELLVVITIIAILMSILFPIFSRAREKARSIACASNLRQIGMASMQYQQDHDERLMLTISDPFNFRTPRWSQMLQPYMKNTQIFQCPSLPKVKVFGLPSTIGAFTQSYGMNRWLAGSHDAQHETPSSTGLIGDVLSTPSNTAGQQFGSWYRPPNDPTLCPNRDVGMLSFIPGSLQGGCLRTTIITQQLPTGREDDPANIHNDGSNYLFLDGHVKFLKYTNRPNSCDDNQRVGGGYAFGCPGSQPGVMNPQTNIWG